MTPEKAKANYAAYVERTHGNPEYTEEQWVAWQTAPGGYRGDKETMGTGHENWLHRGYGQGIAVPAYESGYGSDPGLFGGWSMR